MHNDAYEDIMPRRAPSPTPLIETAVTPSVPEVSLLFDVDRSKASGFQTAEKSHPAALLQRNQFESYNTWKAKNAQVLQNVTMSASHGEPQLKQTRPYVNGLAAKRQWPPGKSQGETGEAQPQRCQVENAPQVQVERHQTKRLSQRYEPQVQVETNQMKEGSQRYEPQVQIERNQMERLSHRYEPQVQIERNQVNGVSQRYEPQVQVETNQMKEGSHRYEPQVQIERNQVNGVSQRYEPQVHIERNQVNGVSQRYEPQVQVKTNEMKEVSQRYEPQVQIERNQMERLSHRYEPQVQIERNQVNGVSQRYEPQVQIERNQMERLSHRYEPQVQIERNQVNGVSQRYEPQVQIERNQMERLSHRYEPQVQIERNQVNGVSQRYEPQVQVERNQTEGVTQRYETQMLLNIMDRIASLELNLKASKSDVNEEPHCQAGRRQVGCQCATASVSNQQIMDLYNIIHLQNEQILLLQQQVKQVLQVHLNCGPLTAAAAASPTAAKSDATVRSVGVMTGLSLEEPKARDKSQRRSTKSRSRVCVGEVAEAVDDSFSLDEAQLVRRLRPRAEDHSPDASLHVHLQDYSQDDSESGSGSGSGSEGEETEPQLGWTFYNQVVGQVNNMLKKPGRSGGHQEWGEAEEDCDDNNWSKRVTFNGDRDSPEGRNHNRSRNRYGNGNHFPRQPQPHGADHMMMYNTNLSFGTLRYLQRCDLRPEQRRGGGGGGGGRRRKASSSKLLDVTALKRQPKLF